MNTIENWKKYIFSLPEQVFFDVMRNYLGDVKTPFNKHDLVDRLTSFLLNDLTAEKILSLIDSSDAEIITLISILEAPTAKELYSLFRDKKSYYDFYLRLLNLEERMLIFCEEVEWESRLNLSPLFLSLFREKVINPELVLTSCENRAGRETAPELIWLNDSVLFAVFSFLLRQGSILKIDGSLRKKVIEELADIFPDKLTGNTDAKIELMRSIIRRLKLAVNRGDFLEPDISRWIELGKISVRERIAIFLGAAVSENYTLYGPFLLSVAETVVSWGMGFSAGSLGMIIRMVALKNRISIEWDGEFSDMIISTLEILGIIREEAGTFYPENVLLYENSCRDEASVILQPNFDVITDPSIPFSSGIILSLLADVQRYSDVISLSLTRDTFVRALEAGFTGKEIADFFKNHNSHGVPQNIMFSFQSWEKEFRSIELFNGIVMTVDEKKRKIIDNSGQFDEDLVKKLADGVYLVKPENLEKLKKALFMSGVEHFPSFEAGELYHGRVKTGYLYSFENDVENFRQCRILAKPDFCERSFPDSCETDVDSFMERIKSLSFTEEQIKNITERIERKILLFPQQITEGSARYEKNEAKGLDYSGKIRLAEQAIESRGYLLEIVERKNDELVTSLVKPEFLDKSDKDVVLEGIILPDEERVSIRIGKASLVKKIKTSLFMK